MADGDTLYGLRCRMHLVQLFLPVYGNDGHAFPRALFDGVRTELADAFGGVTAFVRSPAVGLWESDSGAVCRDDVVLFEVMTDALDRAWWAAYRQSLERRFEQDAVLVRASAVERL